MATRRTKGEGSIRLRSDGRWEATLTLATMGGKRRRRSFFGRTKAEAAAKMRQAQTKADNGLPLPSERLTTSAYLTQWLQGKTNLRPESRRRYDDSIRLHLIPQLGRKPLAKLTPADLRAAYAALLGQGLSGTTVSLAHGVIRTALQDAAADNLVARNVASLVKAPPRSTKERRPLTAAEARRLLDAAKGDPLEALWTLALTGGLRLGELLALQWDAVDLDRCRVRVVATLAGVEDGKPILAAPKTDKSRREVTLSAVAVDALQRHHQAQREARIKVAQHWTDNDLVFCNAFGRPLDGNNLRARPFADLLARAKLPAMRLHDLRHAAASLLLAEGVGIKVISAVLGHADINVTLKVYAHLMPGDQDSAAEAMDRLLGVR